MSTPTEDQDARQRVLEEAQYLRDCMQQGQLIKAGPVAFGVFILLEYRKKLGRSNRHWILNSLIGGFAGICFARMVNAPGCRRKTMENFPNGELAKLMHYRQKTDQNQVQGYEDSQPISQGFQNDSSVPENDASGDGQYEDNTSKPNTSRGMTFQEARARYRAKSQQEDTQAQGDYQTSQGGFFTDTDNSSRSHKGNAGKNKYGDSWDTSN